MSKLWLTRYNITGQSDWVENIPPQRKLLLHIYTPSAAAERFMVQASLKNRWLNAKVFPEQGQI